MTKAGPIASFRNLSGERKRLLLRATWMLGGASAAVALMPFRYAIRLGSTPLGGRTRPNFVDIVWAVEAAAKRLPWRTACIEKGLVAQRMLRSAGVDAILHYGARHHPDTRKLEAHVWVSVGGVEVIGGAEAPQFTLVASYP